MAPLMFFVHAHASVIFADNFNSGASPLWGNDVGSWSATGGVYKATSPSWRPSAFSSLPFDLRDFSVDFDINDVTDGGIWLRSSPAPGIPRGIKGVLLNLKVPDGGARIYWTVVDDGPDYGTPLNMVSLAYGNNPHLRIEVSGNTYSAFVNGSTTSVTTFTTSEFPDGKVALYDYSEQSFDNFILQVVPEPSTGLLLVFGGFVALYWKRSSQTNAQADGLR